MKILAELVSTEERYVDDLQAVLEGYKNKLDQTYLTAKTGRFRYYHDNKVRLTLPTYLTILKVLSYIDLVRQPDRILSNALNLDEIFGNMEDIFTFHSQCLLPKLDYCGDNVTMLAQTFTEYSLDICKLYRR